MKTTIAEVLTLFVAVAAVLAASQLPQNSEYVWLKSTLTYTEPATPLEFDDNGRPPPYSRLVGILLGINTVSYTHLTLPTKA